LATPPNGSAPSVDDEDGQNRGLPEIMSKFQERFCSSSCLKCLHGRWFFRMNSHEAFSAFPEILPRQRMYSPALTDVAGLLPFAARLKAAPRQLVRPPETGMTTARGRMGATGARIDFFTLPRGEDDAA
jgi:hypothetical protein